MASVTRVNPVLTNNSGRNHGVLYSTLQLKAFSIDCGGDISAKTGAGSALEALTRELGTTAALFESAGTAGKFIVIGDGHAIDAAGLQIRVRNLGTVDSYSFGSAAVTELTSLFDVSSS